jgi:hypothetical protein
LSLGLFPHSFFLRLGYTESLFLLCAVVSMYAIERRWPGWLIALIVGFTTATRPVGVALVAVFALHLWQESRRGAPSGLDATKGGSSQASAKVRWRRSWRHFLPRAALFLPVACWGLAAYMLFSHYEFGDALAFAHSHDLWSPRPTPLGEKIVPLLKLEPLWSPFVPGNALYWGNDRSTSNPLFVAGFVNPIVFVATAALVIVGAAKRWLSSREVLLSALLLAIPYVTMAHDNYMRGQGRFCSVVFPAFIVLARLLRPLPWWAIAIFFLACASLLGAYSALYGGGYGQTYMVLY